ncbi:hypothetical protein KHQ81_04455 [Mycoplasmatota bacterium]|nr:hypothetical protein KHQ81_04455 [Mycoplasmatota bacterium]
MIKLRIIYNYEKKIWELFHQDLVEKIACNHNIYDLIVTGDAIAKLIKPAQIIFVPQNLMKEIIINEYME